MTIFYDRVSAIMNVMSLVYFKSVVKYIPYDDSAPESKHGWFLFTVLTDN